MSIESLKAQARRHERDEQWQEALEQYGRALRQMTDDDQVDIGLHNRVGDLYVRVGNYEQAREHYERAVALYREAALPNNAIAVCKKIVRHMPARSEIYLTMGQIRAEQGFIPDARTNFLAYAERMQEEGNLTESFRALVEFCDLAPEEVELRVTVAEQMAANGRTDDAVAQLTVAHRAFRRMERDDRVFGLERRLLELDPGFDFDAQAPEEESLAPDSPDYAVTYGEVALDEPSGVGDAGSTDGTRPSEADPAGEARRDDRLVTEPEEVPSAWEAPADAELPEVGRPDEDAPDDDFFAAAVDEASDARMRADPVEAPPNAAPDDDAGEEADDFELPFLEGTDDWGSGEDEGTEPFTLVDADRLRDVEPTVEPDEGVFEEAPPRPAEAGPEREPPSAEPVADIELAEPVIEPAEPIESVEDIEPAEPVEPVEDIEPAEPVDPVEDVAGDGAAGGDDYVDLGSMIFGDEEARPRTTRFQVAYQEPSGDEIADFQRMLSQFKEKVSENVDATDVRAHHDLGTAYKEMGLLDEAISEFQAALRAAPAHLPTFELLGQTFMEMGKHEAAVKALERALKVPEAVEDELVGIYYYLARAYESLERPEAALEFYDRVFALDINFADVTERLRALR